MSDREQPTVTCAEPGCTASHKVNRWASTKAHDAGWFEQKDGTAWCPDHTPAWVAEWRARKPRQ